MITPIADIARPTRGLKNRNPGNLRANPKVKWRGQISVDAKGFAIFDDDVNGLRAIIIDLHTGYVRDHQVSILGLIAEYAPPVENDTKKYARFVADRLGVDPLASIPFDRPTAAELAKAIVRIEQGIQPYADVIIACAVEAAFAHFEDTNHARA